MSIKSGVYQHYKGNTYQVIGEALHTEKEEYVVVYRALYDDPELGPNALFVRPKDMFQEQVEYKGELIPRFKKIT